MTIHTVKIDEHWYWLLNTGVKTHEVRRADRDYQAGDSLLIEGHGYRSWKITHVLNCETVPGIQMGYVVLSLEHPDKARDDRRCRERGERLERMRRSNAALRGVITRLRNQISERKYREAMSS